MLLILHVRAWFRIENQFIMQLLLDFRKIQSLWKAPQVWTSPDALRERHCSEKTRISTVALMWRRSFAAEFLQTGDKRTARQLRDL